MEIVDKIRQGQLSSKLNLDLRFCAHEDLEKVPKHHGPFGTIYVPTLAHMGSIVIIADVPASFDIFFRQFRET